MRKMRLQASALLVKCALASQAQVRGKLAASLFVAVRVNLHFKRYINTWLVAMMQIQLIFLHVIWPDSAKPTLRITMH
jgi:hypothetical protein